MNDMMTEMVLSAIAKQQGKSVEETRTSIQATLDQVWESDDPESVKTREQMFPEGKPTLGEFIQKMAAKVMNQ